MLQRIRARFARRFGPKRPIDRPISSVPSAPSTQSTRQTDDGFGLGLATGMIGAGGGAIAGVLLHHTLTTSPSTPEPASSVSSSSSWDSGYSSGSSGYDSGSSSSGGGDW